MEIKHNMVFLLALFRGSNNNNMNILRNRLQIDPHYVFYLCYVAITVTF